MLLLGWFVLGCGPKKAAPEAAAPIVGWHAEEGWSGACWYPPDFDAIEAEQGTAARSLARQESLEAMVAQWRGQREDGIAFDPDRVEDAETTLLGYPDRIEETARENLEHCRQAMATGDDSAWAAWLAELPARLTEGECLTPLVNTYFDYLDIGTGWQLEVPMCQGDRAHITATEKDLYRVEEGGPWINAAGDPNRPTVGEENLPCNQEGCYLGMLIGRFVGESGVENIFPIGLEATFTAPENGVLSIAINDTTYYDNTWHQTGTITDHTGIQIEPAE